MSASAHLIELRKVTKRYAAVSVLADVSLNIARGESLAIVGPSGSGKSTLLQIIGTLDRATSGEVFLDGKNLAGLDDLQLAEVRNKQIGFVFQSHYLLPQCTVLENVLVPTLARSSRREKAHSNSPLRTPHSNDFPHAHPSQSALPLALASGRGAGRDHRQRGAHRRAGGGGFGERKFA